MTHLAGSLLALRLLFTLPKRNQNRDEDAQRLGRNRDDANNEHIWGPFSKHVAQFENNAVAAEQFSERLLDSALSLGQAPLVGCRIKGFPHVRMTVSGRYLIIYKVEPAQKRLLVLRFWHSARDLGKLRLPS